MQARLVPMTLLAGIAAGVGTIAVYQWVWGLVLAAATVLLVLFSSPPGWGSRLPFGAGFAGVVTLLASTRGEGDYLVSASAHGYVVIGLALLVLTLSVATIPRPRSWSRAAGEAPPDRGADKVPG